MSTKYRKEVFSSRYELVNGKQRGQVYTLDRIKRYVKSVDLTLILTDLRLSQKLWQLNKGAIGDVVD
jgi:hypothetical protein